MCRTKILFLCFTSLSLCAADEISKSSELEPRISWSATLAVSGPVLAVAGCILLAVLVREQPAPLSGPSNQDMMSEEALHVVGSSGEPAAGQEDRDQESALGVKWVTDTRALEWGSDAAPACPAGNPSTVVVVDGAAGASRGQAAGQQEPSVVPRPRQVRISITKITYSKKKARRAMVVDLNPFEGNILAAKILAWRQYIKAVLENPQTDEERSVLLESKKKKGVLVQLNLGCVPRRLYRVTTK